MTQMNLSRKKRFTDIENSLVVARGAGRGGKIDSGFAFR